ncbi:MAG: UDP-N-acetylmuramoyl-tripeptide--D-alanyl-D-alanine ligase [Candidatus Dojkabacteria bacterium]|nr:MAG: UDP-N-acetylmuramoyl-tripeptide--D-alanyl-D-alanine ligase [Candidatus Dojkabacteria bacterium]
MQTVSFIILTTLFLTIVVGSLPTIYQFQTQDHMLYRILRRGDNRLGLIPFKLPAKSTHNLIIFGLAGLANLATYLFLLQNEAIDSYLHLAAITIVWALLGKLYLLLALVASNFIANIKRSKQIASARQRLAQFPDLQVIGITGSYGKTSVKENIAQILATKFKVAKTPSNNNTLLGHALAILHQLKSDDRYLVAEYGAYRKGEIKEMVELLPPKFAVLTGLGNQHLELFGSQRNLIEAKSELFQKLPEDGVAYLNCDTAHYSEILPLIKGRKITYSLEDRSADLYASEIVVDIKTKSSFKVEYKGNHYEFECEVLGKHNILNLLPAIAIALDLGMSQSEIQDGLNALTAPKERLNLVDLGSIKLLDDSYNSSFEGFLAALDVMQQIGGDLHIVSRGLLELSGDKEEIYAKLTAQINKTGATLWTTDSFFFKYELQNGKHYNSEEKLYDELSKSLGNQSVLLIEGRVNPALKEKFLSQYRAKAN